MLVAALPRIYLLLVCDYLIADDGILYIWQAEKISASGISALPYDLVNPFPFAVSLLHWLINSVFPVSFETAALLITVSCGLALLYPLYKLVYQYFGPLPAFVSAIFIALLPELTDISCSVLRDTPALCAVMWGFYLFLSAIHSPDAKNWRLGRLFFSGALIFLGGMIRLEMFIFSGALGLTLLLAHVWPIKPYRPFKRFIACIAFGAVLIAGCLSGFLYLHASTGQWHLGPFERIFQQHGLAEIKTKVDPFAMDKDQLYEADGTVRPHVLVHYKFMSMAQDHRRVLYIFEVCYKIWKAFLPVGLVMFFAGLWFLARRRMLYPADPLILSCLFITAILISVYYLYASTHFYVGTRHVLAIVIPLSVFIGIPVLYLPSMSRLVRLSAAVFAILALFMLCFKTFQPLHKKKLPMKQCGIALRQYLPTNAILFTSASMKQVPYYAHVEYRMFVPQTSETLKERLTKSPNRFLLLNTHDDWQAAFTNFTHVISLSDLKLPVDKRYVFSLYTAAREDSE